MARAERNYKDTLFRMIFQEKNELLSLYNALNGTSYEDAEGLEINTLENAIYINLKNDISFIFELEMSLYEHQSSFNPNIPLRNLFYIGRLYEKYVTDKTLYSSTQVEIPTPRFMVFYNGKTEQPERTELKLSSAFQKKMLQPELELTVTMLNINAGHNKGIAGQCKALREYIIYVEKVRKYAQEMGINEAVERSVNECIREGILKDLLLRNKSEVIQMSIFEYDEVAEKEKIRKAEQEYGLKLGIEQGIEQGITQGKNLRNIMLIHKKKNKGLSISEIAEHLEADENYVKNIINLLTEYPDESDLQIAQRLRE